MENHGVKNREPLATEWIAGEETGIVGGAAVTDWKPYLPYGERQYNAHFDTLACTHFASGHIYETFIIYLWKTGQLSEEAKSFFTKFLKDPNDINSFRVSKQFSAILGGNTKQGNYFTKAWDTWRIIGAIPDSMLNTLGTSTSWDEYHDKNHITAEMIAVAVESLKYADVLYQWLSFDNMPGFSSFEKSQAASALLSSPLNAGIPIPSSHSVELFSLEDQTYGLFNTYDPFVSHVSLENPNVNYILQGVVKPRQEAPGRPSHVFNQDISRGMRGKEVYALQQVLVYEGFLNKNLLVNDPVKAFFGQNTFDAIIKLQEKYADQILVPLSLAYATGYVGASTRAWLNSNYK